MKTRFARRVARFISVILMMALIAAAVAQAPNSREEKKVPEDRVELEVYTDGVKLTHRNKYFFAPYRAAAGESFGSLSEKFYGTGKYAVALSEVNGVSPTEPLKPGSIVYITSSSAILRFAKGKEEALSRVVQQYLAVVKDPRNLTFVWDEAATVMELSKEGTWILNKFDTAKLRVFDPVTQKPELQFSFKSAPLLQVLFGESSYVTNVAIEP